MTDEINTRLNGVMPLPPKETGNLLVDKQALLPYKGFGGRLVKYVKPASGKKHPADDGWQDRDYTDKHIDEVVDQGFNIGYVLAEDELCIDLDPRDYTSDNTERVLATLLGCNSFDDMIASNPTVRTGGGGWHIYFKVPRAVSELSVHDNLSKYSGFEDMTGVELKKYGNPMMAAGAVHPNGNVYTWHTIMLPNMVSQVFSELLITAATADKTDISQRNVGYDEGVLTGPQLKELILDRLDPAECKTYNAWLLIMLACNRATAGAGKEQFLDWCARDDKYSGCRETNKSKWHTEDPSKVGVGAYYLLELISSGLVYDRDAWEADKDIKQLRNLLYKAQDKAMGELGYGKNLVFKQLTADYYHDLERDAYSNEDKTRSKIEIMAHIKQMEVGSISNKEANRLINDILDLGIAVGYSVGQMLAEKIGKAFYAEIKRAVTAENKKRTKINRINDLATHTCKQLEKRGRPIAYAGSSFYQYTGTHWEDIEQVDVCNFVNQVVRLLGTADVGRHVDTEGMFAIDQAIRYMQHNEGVNTYMSEFKPLTQPRNIINCLNTELHLGRDGSVVAKPHSPANRLSFCPNITYDPKAECPKFDQLMDSLFDHEDYVNRHGDSDKDEVKRHVLELMGYAIQVDKNIPTMVIFEGSGGNGKSTLLSVLKRLLGDDQRFSGVYSGSSDLLGDVKNLDKHKSVNLVNKRCTVIEELPNGVALNDATIKTWSEGVRLSANPKYKSEFDFWYQGVIFAGCNGNPRIKNIDGGLSRRVQLVSFLNCYTPDVLGRSSRKDIANIKTPVIDSDTEMSGVLNRVLAAWQGLVKRNVHEERPGFLVPYSCKLARAEMFDSSNGSAMFIKEHLVKTDSSKDSVPLKELKDKLSAWLHDEDRRPIPSEDFERALKGLGYKIITKGSQAKKVQSVVYKSVLNLYDEFVSVCLEKTVKTDIIRVKDVYLAYKDFHGSVSAGFTPAAFEKQQVIERLLEAKLTTEAGTHSRIIKGYKLVYARPEGGLDIG